MTNAGQKKDKHKLKVWAPSFVETEEPIDGYMINPDYASKLCLQPQGSHSWTMLP